MYRQRPRRCSRFIPEIARFQSCSQHACVTRCYGRHRPRLQAGSAHRHEARPAVGGGQPGVRTPADTAPRARAAQSLRRGVWRGRVTSSDNADLTVVRRPGVADLNTDPNSCSDVLNAKRTL